MLVLETASSQRHALYYPFHLCHERTLRALLDVYGAVHFRDYMAVRLTPLSGTTAFNDRMGGYYPEELRAGRIVQGYPVSGPLDADMQAAIDRDLADPIWRQRFHTALRDDRRFQRGLFDLSHAVRIGSQLVPGPAALLTLLDQRRVTTTVTVRAVQEQSRRRLASDDAYAYEYGFALLMTSAALHYTIRLCRDHQLEAVTDSLSHFELLSRTSEREGLVCANHLVERQGY